MGGLRESEVVVGATAVCVSVSVRDFAVPGLCLVGPWGRTLVAVKRDGRKEGSGCSDAMAWHYRRSLQSSSRLGRRPYGQQQDCVIWR